MGLGLEYRGSASDRAGEEGDCEWGWVRLYEEWVHERETMRGGRNAFSLLLLLLQLLYGRIEGVVIVVGSRCRYVWSSKHLKPWWVVIFCGMRRISSACYLRRFRESFSLKGARDFKIDTTDRQIISDSGVFCLFLIGIDPARESVTDQLITQVACDSQ